MARRHRRLAGTTVALALLAAVPAAQADERSPEAGAAFAANCPGLALGTPFLPWGDAASYFAVAGSSFEGTNRWTLRGSAIVADNEPFGAGGAGTQALEVPGGASATSPAICADATMTSMRIFVRRISGAGMLHVSASIARFDRINVELGTFAGQEAWAPSAPLIFNASTIRALSFAGAVPVKLGFSADAGTVFRIDGVYVDPYRRV